jgi:DnaJ-domain-containing protein 1
MTFSEGAAILFGLFAGYWVVSKLFFRPPTAQQRPETVPPPSTARKKAEWHEVLQVSPSAPIAEIRAAYKLLISKYHPDKVDALGDDLKDLAEHKTQEITVAYREAMRARGEQP